MFTSLLSSHIQVINYSSGLNVNDDVEELGATDGATL